MSWKERIKLPSFANRWFSTLTKDNYQAGWLLTRAYAYARRAYVLLSKKITYRLEGASSDSKATPRTVWKSTRLDVRKNLRATQRTEKKVDSLLAQEKVLTPTEVQEIAQACKQAVVESIAKDVVDEIKGRL